MNGINEDGRFATELWWTGHNLSGAIWCQFDSDNKGESKDIESSKQEAGRECPLDIRWTAHANPRAKFSKNESLKRVLVLEYAYGGEAYSNVSMVRQDQSSLYEDRLSKTEQ